MRKETVLKGLAGAAAMAGATQAYGTVLVDANPANIVGHAPATTDTGTRTYIDVDGNRSTQGSSAAASFTGYDLQLRYRNLTETNGTLLLAYVYAPNSGSTVGASISGQAYTYNLAAGTSINSASPFYQKAGYLTHIVTNYKGTDYGFGTTGAIEYVGFKFTSGTQTDYGYLELEVDPYVSAANPGGIQFLKLAYDNTGAAILAGANGVPNPVPEPGTVGALAFGAAAFAGVAAKRRQRNRAAQV